MINVVEKKNFSSSIKYTVRRDWLAWLLMTPSLILFIFIVWYPLIQGLVLSFYETKGFESVAFCGMQNYKDIFSDTAFKAAFANTFKYLGWSLLLGYLVPVIVALILNEMSKGMGVFQFSIYFPSIVPGIAVALMWMFLYDPGQGGIINMILKQLGMPMSQMLQNSKLTIPLIIVSMTWKGFGATAIVYLASMRGISQELYEAAIIDGASIKKRIQHITLPSIYPILALMLVMQVIGVFQVMVEPMTMTGGGPNNASISLALQAYNYGFNYFQAGKSIATSTVIFVILLGLTSIYFKLKNKLEI